MEGLKAGVCMVSVKSSRGAMWLTWSEARDSVVGGDEVRSGGGGFHHEWLTSHLQDSAFCSGMRSHQKVLS